MFNAQELIITFFFPSPCLAFCAFLHRECIATQLVQPMIFLQKLPASFTQDRGGHSRRWTRFRRSLVRRRTQKSKWSNTRNFLSVVRSTDRDDLREGRKGVLAIIISPALPVIAIVLTNAQIAFQIAPTSSP